MGADQIITRRDLPHWYVPGAFHFVTFRLYGTLPKNRLDELRERKVSLLKKPLPPGATRAQYHAMVHKQLFAVYDELLDQSKTIRWLEQPRLAALVRGSLYFLEGKKYHLLSYCIMPNHVHVLFQPIDEVTGVAAAQAGRLSHDTRDTSAQAGRLCHGGELCLGEAPDKRSPLSSIMHSLKSYTANEANRILNRKGVFWQSESYDHWVRNEEELANIVNYIAFNPVRAKLVEHPHEWLFCSAHDRFLQDGEALGWLKCNN